MYNERSTVTEFEAALAVVKLPEVYFDRDALMYEAGRQAERAVRADQRFWRTSTVVALAASLVLGALLVREWNEQVQVVANVAASVEVDAELPSPGVNEVVETEQVNVPSSAASAKGVYGSPPSASTASGWLAWWPGDVPVPPERVATMSLIGRRSQFSDGQRFLSRGEATATPPTVRTARELLDELLGS